MADAPPAPGTPEYRRQLRYAWRVCSVTSLGLIMIGINANTLNVALPAVVRHFEADAFAANWILLSFLLINTSTLVLFGRIADLFGRRETYLIGFAVFILASLLSGFSPNVWILIALRGLQALGAAMILANGTVIITKAFPRDRLSQGMGVYIATLSVAQLAGPSIGGLIAAGAGWRWVFWINVPVGLLALVWGAMTLRRVRTGRREPIDALGNGLIFAALSAALLAASEAGSRGFSGPVVYGGALIFMALLPIIIIVERRAEFPVLDFRLFAQRNIALANASSFFNALARSALVLLASLYFQALRGDDVLTAGLAVLPAPVGMALAAPLAGMLGRWVHPYALATYGALASASGLLVFLIVIDPATPYPPIAVALFLAGCGSGFFLTGNSTGIMQELPPERLGVVNGFRLMIMNIGVVLSFALTLSLVTSGVRAPDRRLVYAGTLAELSPSALDGLATGFQRTLAVLLGVALLGGLAAALCRRRSLIGSDSDDL